LREEDMADEKADEHARPTTEHLYLERVSVAAEVVEALRAAGFGCELCYTLRKSH